MVNPYKTFLKFTIGPAGTLMLGCVALIYILDPFQIYHTSYFYPDKYIGNQDRFQTAGLINRLWDERACCDSVLLGTSHSQNFDGEEMGRILGTKPVLNLSMSGSTPFEQSVIFGTVLRKRKPIDVYWEIHEPFSYAIYQSEIRKNVSSNHFMPIALYNDLILDDAAYLLSVDSFKFFIKGVKSAEPLQIYKAWYHQHIGSFNNPSKILQESEAPISREFPVYSNEAAKFPALDEIVFKAISENPDINFHIFLPPYSHLYYASLNQEEYARMMQMRYYLATRSQEFQNVRIYAFDLLDKIPTADLNRYKDKGHYHPDVNRQMVKYIKDGKGQLTPENIDRHIQTLHSRIQDYSRKISGKAPFPENGS